MEQRHELSDQKWLAILGVLALLAALIRLPSIISVPLNSDAVQYVLAIERFDLASHQPHPPGSPLYILLGRAVDAVVVDPHLSLVLISLIAGAGTVVLSGHFAAALYDRRFGVIVGALILVNPWVWTYSVVALPYTLEAASVLLVGLAVLRAKSRPDVTSAMLLGISTAIAGGIRPTVLPFIGLVFLLGLLFLHWRGRVVGVIVIAIGCLLWLMPLIYASGGFSQYVEETQALSDAAAAQTSLFSAGFSARWVENLQGFVIAFLILTLPLLGFVLISLLRSRPDTGRFDLRNSRVILLWAWITPAILFFVVVHFGQPGYLVFLAPPITIMMVAQMRRSFWSGQLSSKALALRLGPILLVCLALSLLSLSPLRSIEQRWEAVDAFFAEQSFDQSVLFVASSYRVAGYLQPATEVVGIDARTEGEDFSWGPRYVSVSGIQEYRLGDHYPICAKVVIPHSAVVVVYDEELTSRLVNREQDGWSVHRLMHADEDLWYRTFAPNEALSFHRNGNVREIQATSASDGEITEGELACSLEGTLSPIQ